MGGDGLEVPASQRDALRAIPARDMLVDPAELELVLEEPSRDGMVSWRAIAGWTLASLAVTVIVVIVWAATGH
jgi:hypothetical protein